MTAAVQHWKAHGVDLSRILQPPPAGTATPSAARDLRAALRTRRWIVS